MLVSDITFSQLSADSSTARVRVRATRVGYLAQTASGQLAFSADQGVDEYVATAVLMDNGWRLAAPQQMPRVSLTATLQDAPLHDDARRALELKLTERRP